MKRRQFGALALSVLASPALAQGDKVSKLMVGFPPGQATDIVARLLAEALRSELNETVIVDNKPGQGGSIVLGQVAHAPPDGTTFVLAPLASLVINPYLYRNVAYKSLTSFEPVARVCDLPMVLVVHPSVPAKTLPELIAYAKANPDKLSHCSAGNGTLSHVVMEDFKRRAGIRILHVPYQGSPPAMQDLVSGTVQVAIDTVTVTKPHIDSGRLRLIAVGTLERLATWPDTPTIAEQGFPGLEAVAWLGVLLPAKTSADRVKQLSDAVVTAVKDPATAEKFRTVGTIPRAMNAEEFAAFLKSEDRRWSKVIVDSKIKVD
ncbi:MAG TPA: tripartite tricarboxylate transporter substrate binding protein [Reyranella sp.]|nr:tripartite tricarboxylate transporter substrate binding protein [Reyranella sp.]